MSYSAVDSVEELCYRYGWTVEYVLTMSARRMFAILKSGRESERIRQNVIYAELCDIMGMSMGKKYHAGLKKYYLDRIKGIERRGTPKLDAADPKSAEILMGALGQM